MLLKNIQENFPFLSVVQYGGNEYVGIIINQDQWVTSMYVYTDIKDEHQEQEFLQLGETWWWESNRMIPINIFLKKDLEKGIIEQYIKDYYLHINSIPLDFNRFTIHLTRGGCSIPFLCPPPMFLVEQKS